MIGLNICKTMQRSPNFYHVFERKTSTAGCKGPFEGVCVFELVTSNPRGTWAVNTNRILLLYRHYFFLVLSSFL
jgi:hypothetical protein